MERKAHSVPTLRYINYFPIYLYSCCLIDPFLFSVPTGFSSAEFISFFSAIEPSGFNYFYFLAVPWLNRLIQAHMYELVWRYPAQHGLVQWHRVKIKIKVGVYYLGQTYTLYVNFYRVIECTCQILIIFIFNLTSLHTK